MSADRAANDAEEHSVSAEEEENANARLLGSVGPPKICCDDIDGHSHGHVAGHSNHTVNSDLASDGFSLDNVDPSDALMHTHAQFPDAASHIHHLLHHLHNYHQTSRRRMELLLYMMLTCLYFAVCTTLLAANSFDQQFIDAHYFLIFHYTEFWASFLFTLVEAFILVSTDVVNVEALQGKVQLFIVGFNIVGSFVAALLYTFEPNLFERASHFIEYGVQVTITSANFIFILNVPKSGKMKQLHRTRGFWFQIYLNIVLLSMSIVKIFFYAEVIPSPLGHERASHYFEFTGEMVNSAWAFAFAVRSFFKLTRSMNAHDMQLKNE